MMSSASIYAQSKDTLNLNHINLNLDNLFNNKDSLFVLPSFKIEKSQPHYFSIYNSLTTLNDNYLISSENSSPIYVSSKKLIKNDLRLNKIDSFNPYGSSSFGSGLALGVFDFLLGKL